MKLYVTVEEFLYAKKIENQTERTLRGYKNGNAGNCGSGIYRHCSIAVRMSGRPEEALRMTTPRRHGTEV